MSDAHNAPSGLNPALTTLLDSSEITSLDAKSFLLILRLLAIRSHALDSLHDQTLRLLFQSMTPATRKEAIGHLRSMSGAVGSLYVRSLRLQKYLSSSRTDCMISRSSSGQRASE